MNGNDQAYRKLAEHLDRLPDGFAPAVNGEDIALLERLFTPEEAKLAVCLTLDREGAQTIAGRAGLDPGVAREMLEEMARKGLIMRHLSEDGSHLYQAAPLVIGIYEFQVGNLTPELIDAFHAYWRTEKVRSTPYSLPQMRTIPIGASIESSLEILPYEAVDRLVEENEKFAVAPCICRREAKITGEGCEAPEESCLILGDWAEYYVSTGRARAVDRWEIKALLKRADEANLVLQPSNSREIEFICCCCGCCCGVLGGIKAHPKPSEIVESSFEAALDTDLCTGCMTCLDRCQMDALKESEGTVELDPDRCIGCGLCVTTCPPGALSLVRRTDRKSRIPDSFDSTWKLISRMQQRSRSHSQ